MENIDKTVDTICNWIQNEIKNDNTVKTMEISDMISALAELIEARALYV